MSEPILLKFYVDKECMVETPIFYFRDPVGAGETKEEILYCKNISMSEKIFDINITPLDSEVKTILSTKSLDPNEIGLVRFSWSPSVERKTALHSTFDVDYKRLIT